MERALLRLLRCSVCNHYTPPPVIEICSRGHNGCASCVRQLTRCPVCQLPAQKTWNAVVEDACRDHGLQIPCNNWIWGCPERLTIDDLTSHGAVCIFQQQSCPFSPPYGSCLWRGTIADLQRHLAEKHRDCSVVITEEETIRISSACVDKKIVVLRGAEVFVIVTYFSIPCHLNYICVIGSYVGPNNGFPSYLYQFIVGESVIMHEEYSVTNPENKHEGGLHVHVPAYVMDEVFKTEIPIRERKCVIKITKYFPPSGDDNLEEAESLSEDGS